MSGYQPQGFGFNPSYQPQPAPTRTPANNASIFGVISQVNMGRVQPQAPVPGSVGLQQGPKKSILKKSGDMQQANSVVEKMVNVQPELRSPGFVAPKIQAPRLPGSQQEVRQQSGVLNVGNQGMPPPKNQIRQNAHDNEGQFRLPQLNSVVRSPIVNTQQTRESASSHQGFKVPTQTVGFKVPTPISKPITRQGTDPQSRQSGGAQVNAESSVKSGILKKGLVEYEDDDTPVGSDDNNTIPDIDRDRLSRYDDLKRDREKVRRFTEFPNKDDDKRQSYTISRKDDRVDSYERPSYTPSRKRDHSPRDDERLSYTSSRRRDHSPQGEGRQSYTPTRIHSHSPENDKRQRYTQSRKDDNSDKTNVQTSPTVFDYEHSSGTKTAMQNDTYREGFPGRSNQPRDRSDYSTKNENSKFSNENSKYSDDYKRYQNTGSSAQERSDQYTNRSRNQSYDHDNRSFNQNVGRGLYHNNRGRGRGRTNDPLQRYIDDCVKNKNEPSDNDGDRYYKDSRFYDRNRASDRNERNMNWQASERMNSSSSTSNNHNKTFHTDGGNHYMNSNERDRYSENKARDRSGSEERRDAQGYEEMGYRHEEQDEGKYNRELNKRDSSSDQMKSPPTNQSRPVVQVEKREGIKAKENTKDEEPPLPKIPKGGHYCKDCRLVCLDTDIYNSHLQSDTHLLTLQKKAQALFKIETRQSRFQTDMFGNPLKATIIPTSLMPVMNSSTVVPGVAGVSGSNVLTEAPAAAPVTASPSLLHSGTGIQVVPPKPLGPLETKKVNATWLVLTWRERTELEEQLVDTYVLEYRNARETRWASVGQTNKHEFEVFGLQEGTDYLFRVYAMNGTEKSEMLESVLITTKKKKDSPEHGSHGSRRRSPDRSHRNHKKRSRSRSRDREHKRRSRSLSRERRRRSRSRERRRSKSRSPGKPKRPIKGTSITVKTEQRSGGSGESSDKPEAGDGGNDLPMMISVSENPDTNTVEPVECLLYNEFKHYKNSPLLGLDEIYELLSYNSKTPPRYVCKLCNNKGSHTIIMKHITGVAHMLAFFKKNDTEVYDAVTMIAIKKQKVERLVFEGNKVEDEKGRGAVKVLQMLNPLDHNSKIVYKDPVSVPAPPPERVKEQTESRDIEDLKARTQFPSLYRMAIEKGLQDATLIGLQYVREYHHPKLSDEECRYCCTLCDALCSPGSIIYHVVGKKHRFNFLQNHHSGIYEELSHANPAMLSSMLSAQIGQIAKAHGSGEITMVVPKTDRMFRKTKKKQEEEEAAVAAMAREPEDLQQDVRDPKLDREEAPPEGDGADTEANPQSMAAIQAVKFGIKKTESQGTGIIPVNVLEQSSGKTKGKFDWNSETSSLQAKIQNETIIKSSRKSKFITVYSGFFKKFPVIGLQWVTEFQKPDVKQEPWYMCFMCQHKLLWKNILDHVTSSLHRLNYLKKSDYREKYESVCNLKGGDLSGVKGLIEQYSREVAEKEGCPDHLEVMLELNVNKEALTTVGKVTENIKNQSTSMASSTATDVAGPTSQASVSSTMQIQVVSSWGSGQKPGTSGFPLASPPGPGASVPVSAPGPTVSSIIPLPNMSVPPPGFPVRFNQPPPALQPALGAMPRSLPPPSQGMRPQVGPPTMFSRPPPVLPGQARFPPPGFPVQVHVPQQPDPIRTSIQHSAPPFMTPHGPNSLQPMSSETLPFTRFPPPVSMVNASSLPVSVPAMSGLGVAGMPPQMIPGSMSQALSGFSSTQLSSEPMMQNVPVLPDQMIQEPTVVTISLSDDNNKDHDTGEQYAQGDSHADDPGRAIGQREQSRSPGLAEDYDHDLDRQGYDPESPGFDKRRYSSEEYERNRHRSREGSSNRYRRDRSDSPESRSNYRRGRSNRSGRDERSRSPRDRDRDRQERNRRGREYRRDDYSRDGPGDSYSSRNRDRSRHGRKDSRSPTRHRERQQESYDSRIYNRNEERSRTYDHADDNKAYSPDKGDSGLGGDDSKLTFETSSYEDVSSDKYRDDNEILYGEDGKMEIKVQVHDRAPQSEQLFDAYAMLGNRSDTADALQNKDTVTLNVEAEYNEAFEQNRHPGARPFEVVFNSTGYDDLKAQNEYQGERQVVYGEQYETNARDDEGYGKESDRVVSIDTSRRQRTESSERRVYRSQDSRRRESSPDHSSRRGKSDYRSRRDASSYRERQRSPNSQRRRYSPDPSDRNVAIDRLRSSESPGRSRRHRGDSREIKRTDLPYSRGRHVSPDRRDQSDTRESQGTFSGERQVFRYDRDSNALHGDYRRTNEADFRSDSRGSYRRSQEYEDDYRHSGDYQTDDYGDRQSLERDRQVRVETEGERYDMGMDDGYEEVTDEAWAGHDMMDDQLAYENEESGMVEPTRAEIDSLLQRAADNLGEESWEEEVRYELDPLTPMGGGSHYSRQQTHYSRR